jgi:hypothetical protein
MRNSEAGRRYARRRRVGRRLAWRAALVLLAIALSGRGHNSLSAAPREPVEAERPQPKTALPLPVSKEDRKELDGVVDRGLSYLAAHQNADGSFQTIPIARPAVTSLCVMAFLSRGHHPGEGQYASNIEAAIDYVLTFQDPESGAITPQLAGGGRRGFWDRAAIYTHGICSTMLADCFPFTGRLLYRQGGDPDAAQRDQERHAAIDKAVRKSLQFTRNHQMEPKQNGSDQGGWRYIGMMQDTSDLSVTAWEVMFLHSARKSGFQVPESWMKAALKYVHRTFSKKQHGFVYQISSERMRHCTRATVGGGILCLLLGGEPMSPQIKEAVSFIFKHPFDPYNTSWEPGDRYHYSAFYCGQAMGLIGGASFKDFYPGLLRVLSQHQKSDGSWEPEQYRDENSYGEVYTTALAILALSPPYQKLETYKR